MPHPETPRAHQLGVLGSKRVLAIDIERCSRCAGRSKIIAAIVDPRVIVQILTHPSLPARASPRSPARALPLFQAA